MMDLWYKGYVGSVEVSPEDDCLYGQILGIDDLVSYTGPTLEVLLRLFQEAVDDYLETCQELGREPAKTSTYWGLKQ